MTFRLTKYSLMSDIFRQQKKPFTMGQTELQTSPLVVMNNFNSSATHMSLMTGMFQSLFPKLDVPNMQVQ